MPSYIAIQSTYDVFEMALFVNNKLIDQLSEDKRHTSKLFIPLLDQLLKQHSTKINDLDFCAVNCGPGPFSTLRSIIASVNGLHLATNIPLIGIDGLDATFLEFYDNNYQNSVILLNAFNNEVYYLIAQKDQILSKGYKKIDTFLQNLASPPARPEPVEGYLRAVQKNLASINFMGNGVTLHQDLIKEIVGNNAIIKANNPSMCSIEMIGKLGLKKWVPTHIDGLSAPSTKLRINCASATAGYLMPLHLKKHPVEL